MTAEAITNRIADVMFWAGITGIVLSLVLFHIRAQRVVNRYWRMKSRHPRIVIYRRDL